MKTVKTIEDKLISHETFFDLQFIYEHFGELNQVEKFNEEVEEFLASGADEEIVDVWMVATQLIMNSDKLKQLVEFKRKRTLERIKQKFYDID